jgi:hypothetical protein
MATRLTKEQADGLKRGEREMMTCLGVFDCLAFDRIILVVEIHVGCHNSCNRFQYVFFSASLEDRPPLEYGFCPKVGWRGWFWRLHSRRLSPVAIFAHCPCSCLVPLRVDSTAHLRHHCTVCSSNDD